VKGNGASRHESLFTAVEGASPYSLDRTLGVPEAGLDTVVKKRKSFLLPEIELLY
jgi:hypothetical protein